MSFAKVYYVSNKDIVNILQFNIAGWSGNKYVEKAEGGFPGMLKASTKQSQDNL